MNLIKKHIGFAAIAVLLWSCVKDKPVPAVSPTVQLSSARKVYIVNEGNFGSGNSSVSLYDPSTGQLVDNIYSTVNGSAMGDVAQDMAFINGRFYTVVNNSGKVLVCDAGFKKVAQITGLSSPRYIQQVSNQKAYVSDLQANCVNIIDLSTNSRTGSIACSGWTEKMAMIYNKVFVTNVKRNYVYVVNTLTDAINDSIYVGANASGLVIDKNDRVWVLAAGDSAKHALPRLTKINAVNNAVDRYFDFGAHDKPGYLCINGGKDSLYFVDVGIRRMLISDNALPASAVVSDPGRNFYGLGVSPANYRIYAADALDYSQKSDIYEYSVSGARLNRFKAGINANGFYFE